MPENTDLSKLILPDNCYKGEIKIDANALFNTNPKNMNFENAKQLNSIMTNANDNLQAIYGFVFDPISCNFMEITESEIGQFYSKNSYIFLCIYKVNNDTEDGDNENDSDDSDYENDSELAQFQSTKSHTIIGKKKTFNHKMNCVVYFWQGTMANRFAWLSFLYSKKDQIEAGTLAAYNEPLHVIILNQGNECLPFLSHLNNYCVYYKNKRLNYYDEANIVNPLSYTCSNENINMEDEDDKSIIYKKQTLRMFHIQTNQKYKTTRAWEVDIKAESLVTRDCFLVIYNNLDFIQRDSECNSELDDNGSTNNVNEEEIKNEEMKNNFNSMKEEEEGDISIDLGRKYSVDSYASTVTSINHRNEKPAGENGPFICDLWVGKGASKDEVRRAIDISKWISELMASDEPLSVKKPDNFGFDLNTIQNSNLSILDGKYTLNLIQEGSESDQFWNNLGVNVNAESNVLSTSSSFYGTDKRRTLIKNYSSSFLLNMKKKKLNIYYGKGTESWYMKPPRFFKCDCSQGYFSAREIENFCQYDLSDDSCIILDSNSPGKIYVWIGRNSSDVVRKLTQKSVEVWLTNIDDGRWYDSNFLTLSKNSDEAPTTTNNSINNIKQTQNETESDNSHTSNIQEKKEDDIIEKLNNCLEEDPYIKRMRERRERKTKKAPKKSDVVIEYQGEESIDFKSFFFGWSEEVSKNINYDPGNSYIKEMAKKKKQREELCNTAEYYEPLIYRLCNVDE
ncbi:hypothetical protein BCR36DRAFT_179495 [Piromyces finnis]|uniref:Gelsolin-like domain-containing protein n=1 Tax=Piromyces finnis TaxID=1754191 RepID=A0A1Y1UUI7_9FUNG|nr:hypothetical protein BCR36DRAFT_179495 [Piromyces finnis]|eukprot:ORX41676.1 hypothetical protein BCR36DRAFT_179495 [Piromyces finnis]